MECEPRNTIQFFHLLKKTEEWAVSFPPGSHGLAGGRLGRPGPGAERRDLLPGSRERFGCALGGFHLFFPVCTLLVLF